MRKRDSGFALLEALLAFVILAVGALAVTSLQGYLTSQSAVSKARTEALGMAEDKLEELRNYVWFEDDSQVPPLQVAADEDNYTPADGTHPDSGPELVQGVNAEFSRSWTITTMGDMKTLIVNVSWMDQRGEDQEVSLQSEVTWNPPGGAGYLATPLSDTLVPSPSGRATLGEGEFEFNEETDELVGTNMDGTLLYSRGSDLLLVDTSEEGDGRVVLTLKDACETDDCTDFVRIEGELYLDHANTTRDAEDVFVRASDASFCKRWYIVPGTEDDDIPLISTDMSSAPYTAGSAKDADYQYFRYTCYLGGGWHGNIGVLFSGGLAQNDKVCQGDPNSQDEVLAVRRVYRGFLYKSDSSTACEDDSNTACGREQVDGDVVYYSIGVRDALELDNQDFVVSSFAPALTEDVNCKNIKGNPGPMMRPDSDTGDGLGTLFAGVPTDFVCLNEDNNPDDEYSQDIDQTFEGGALVSYGPRFPAGSADGEFGADPFCPFDPSDPPAESHAISGAITIVDANMDVPPEGVSVVTSDGPDNCTISLAGSSGTYTCTVYDWGGGWTGQIKPVHSSVDMVCESSVPSSSDITSSVASFSDITSDQSADFDNCTKGAKVSLALFVYHEEGFIPDPSLENGSCVYGGSESSGDQVTSFLNCATDVFKDSWEGTLTIPPAGEYVCGSDESDGDGDFLLEYTSADAGAAPVEMYVTITKNGNGCDPKE
jgi:type II secretory pathway pseudopilin PulG